MKRRWKEAGGTAYILGRDVPGSQAVIFDFRVIEIYNIILLGDDSAVLVILAIHGRLLECSGSLD